MSEFRIRSTGETILDLRRAFPDISLPISPSVDDLDALGVDPVFEGPQATGGTVYQYSQRDGVEQINGNWYTKYILGPVFTDKPAQGDESAQTASEQEAAYKELKDDEQSKSVRASRNDKLAESDWTQVIDAPVDQTAWATYRQGLRDITSQVGFPWGVIWPEQPE